MAEPSEPGDSGGRLLVPAAASTFAGRVAIVTGGASGIGRATAEHFAVRGATVVLADVDGPSAQATARAIGPRALAVACDVADTASVRAMVAEVVDRFGRLDVLVNNAGIAVLERGTFLDTREADWDRVMAVDLRGLFFCTQVVARVLVERRSGCIVHVSSQAGRSYSHWQGPHYHAAKAAVDHLTTIMAIELGPFGVRVNAVAPNAVRTPALASNEVATARLAALLKEVPLGRVAEPEEVAATIGFLASDAAAYITGQVLPVNGGLLTHSWWP